jgi:hypothetical protein
MKNLFLTTAFVLIASFGFAQKDASKVSKPLQSESVTSEKSVEITLNSDGKQMSESMIAQQIKRQTSSQRVSLDKGELEKVSKYIFNVQNAVYGNVEQGDDVTPQPTSIKITITWTNRKGRTWTVTIGQP